MKLLIAVLMIGLCGCGPDKYAPMRPAREDHSFEQAMWLNHYTVITNSFTARVYQCEVEMMSLAYTPVRSGPVCRTVCDLEAQVNAMVDSAPSYIDNPKQYRIKDNKFCKSKKAKP